jgi:hypothetical protein
MAAHDWEGQIVSEEGIAMTPPARPASWKWVVCGLLLSAFLASVPCGCASHSASGESSEQLGRERATESERAFDQERQADVVVFYDTASVLVVTRPAPERHFVSEASLLAHLTERKASKRLLVVILSKRHEWSEPRQTLEGFWEVCKRTGFKNVIIQQSRAWGRPILRE